MSWNIKTPGDYINGPLTVAGSATITGDLTVDTSTLKVDSANNRVGINTASPTATFSALIGSEFLHFGFGANNDNYYTVGASGTHIWRSSSTEQMRLNATGLGVGVSPVYKLQSVGFAAATSSTVNGSGGNLIGAMLNSDDANSGVNPGVDLRRWTGTALNHGVTYIATNATGDTLFYNGSVASNTRATSLKMTLDASGNLLVRCTTAGSEQLGVQVIGYTNGNYVRINHNASAASGDSYLNLFYNAAQIGSITQNGTTGVLYNINSDYRLKESVQPLVGGLARVNALKPSVYKWKSDGSTGEGFLAHELAEVVPFAVSGEKDAVNEDGSIKSQGIDMSRVVPILVAAIQELTARVQTLETR